MLLFINNKAVKSEKLQSANNSLNPLYISSVQNVRRTLRALHIPFYEVSCYGIRDEVLDPEGPIFKSITGIIISGSNMRLSQSVHDISKYVHILRYLQAFRHVPVLGLCFGAQLLVILYGGFLIDNRVYTCNPVTIELLADHKLFQLNEPKTTKLTGTIATKLSSPRTRTRTRTRSRGHNKTRSIVGLVCFSDIPVVTNRQVKPIAWARGNTSTLAVAYEFERGRVYGSMFHPEYSEDTYYIIKNLFAP